MSRDDGKICNKRVIRKLIDHRYKLKVNNVTRLDNACIANLL